MKSIRLVSIGALAFFLGVLAPTYAQQDQGGKPEAHQQQAKPRKQQGARPGKQEQQQANGRQSQQPKQQQQRARTQPPQNNSQQHRQQSARAQQRQQPQRQWAHSGQQDSRGHEYTPARFGPEHHARFAENGGRYYNGRRDYSYGGYWFYADTYPAWFYQKDVYFIMGADGLWYAVSYGNPSLMFQVNIE